MDHFSFTENTWRSREEFEDREGCYCTTVGWVLKETDDAYTIVSTWHKSEEFEDKFLGDMCILKGTIKSMKTLKE